MQNITLSYEVNPLERLFIDKALELLYPNTIDSFRLRLHNPKTLIEELISVCQSSLSGVLTNNEYAEATSKELVKAIKDDNHGLSFIKVDKKYFTSILSNRNKNNYNLVIQSCKLVLRDNINYSVGLYDELERITSSYSEETEFGTKKRILVLLNHLLVELVNKGYTKQFLYNFFQVMFVRDSHEQQSFAERLEVFKELITREEEEYTVIYNILGRDFKFEEFVKINSEYSKINKRFRILTRPTVPDRVNDFLESHKEDNLIYLKVRAKDYLKAIEMSMETISKDLDIYHLGFNKHFYKIDSQCAVIGTINTMKSSTYPSNFRIDGYIRSNMQVFEILLEKINKIKQNKVDKDSYDKIISAIRYYRTGSESPELETKLLNYWIGLEYIFTAFNNEEKTIDRIRNYFVKCHSLIYIKRNLHDFHKALRRLEIEIDGMNSDLNYLGVFRNYDEICNGSDNELVKFRAKFFQKWVESPGNITHALKNHQENLNWNLTRLYRIRNEIVHNAAIKKGIHIHISHLKYYLTFILNSILDYMADIPEENNEEITIEDYFIAQDIIFGSLNNRVISEYLRIENPSQIFF